MQENASSGSDYHSPTWKDRVRRFMETYLPGLTSAIRAVKVRRYSQQFFRPVTDRTRTLFYTKDSEVNILTGPFQGMKYLDEAVWGSITPKWLGSYEAELATITQEIISSGYQTILDIGCAEGYYATGLAYGSPSSHVFAYDTDFLSRRQTSRLAALNNLSTRVTVKGLCTFVELETRLGSTAAGKGLVFCDIEGFERILLDPSQAPVLQKTDMLVEVHEAGNPSPSTLDLLVSRFSASHHLQSIHATDRSPWVKDFITKHPHHSDQEALLLEATNETRNDGNTWLWMRAKARSFPATSS